MTLLSRALLVLVVLAAAPVEARAQNFFEELFGLRPRPAPIPPGGIPQRGGPAPAPGPDVGEPVGEPARPAAPPPPKPVVLRPPADGDIMGRDLLQNGVAGSLRLERSPAGTVLVRATLAGSRLSQPTQACTVRLAVGEPVPFADKGRPEGVTRVETSDEVCPLRFDLLDGGALATLGGEAESCTFASEDCRVEPVGLWGPAPAALLPRAGEFEQARGGADRAVRENYKVLTQRAGGQAVRPIVAEQAAFSANREQLCRSYAREAAHGFCNLRFTEARALALATRLGIAVSPAAGTTAATRPRRRAPTDPTAVIDSQD